MKQVCVGDSIISDTCSYRVQKILGSGSFGTVSLCHNCSTGQTVALKMLKNRKDLSAAHVEEDMLQALMDSGAADYNIVQWFGSFTYKGHYCLEFEPLDISLQAYLRMYGKFSLCEIRPVAHQMANALTFLKSQGIVHCDLKHDNILLVDHKGLPLKIKVIDFGLALPTSRIVPGYRVQNRCYRAPEVFLGAHFNEAVDVWSLGCILMEMVTGYLLFPGLDDHDAMRHIVHIVGMPPAELLQKGLKTHRYFSHEFNQWKFIEYDARTCNPITKKLHDVFNSDPVNQADECDREFFLDLIELMLKVNPDDRITPEEILRHPYVTLDHLGSFVDLNPDYVGECHRIMMTALCPTEKEELEKPSGSEEEEDEYKNIMQWLLDWNKDNIVPDIGSQNLLKDTTGRSSAKRKHVEEDEIDKAHSKSKAPSPVNGKRRRKDRDNKDDDKPEVIVLSSTRLKRCRVEENTNENLSQDSDGAPQLVSATSLVSIKRPRLERIIPANLSFYSNDSLRLVIVECPVREKRQRENSAETESHSSKRRRQLH